MKRFFYLLLFFVIILPSLTQAKYKKVKLGIDILIEKDFQPLKNKKIALLTNYSGRTGTGKLTLDVFAETDKCKLIKVFAPEHGFKAKVPAGKPVLNDTIRNIPIISLYGSNRKPSIYQLKGIDVVVVDIQDVGVRSYTYISTLFKLMEACAECNIPVIILDRPNPLNGLIIDGNSVEKGKESFVGIAPVPYIHGLTIGELANLFNGENLFSPDEKGKARKCDLSVIKMENWERWMSWEDTKLKWYATSPNIPNVNSIRGMAVLGVMGELGKFSIGMGTDYPFQFISFPGYKDEIFRKYFSTLEFPGVKLEPVHIRELNPRKKSMSYRGYKLKFNPNNNFAPYTLGIQFMLAIRNFNPSLFSEDGFKKNSKEMFCKVTGTDKLFNMLCNAGSDYLILNYAASGVSEFAESRVKYLFYE